MADIKLFVCCHQQVEIPNHPLLVPIQVGAALAETHFPNFLYDDAGENISEKNRSYCELTAQYWAWKNVGADYFGFFTTAVIYIQRSSANGLTALNVEQT